MRRVRGVVHGPTAGLIDSKKGDDRPARRPSIGLQRSGLPSCCYSPECVESKFCELHVNGVLGSTGYSRPPVPSPDGPPTRGSGLGPQPSLRRYPSALVLLP